MLRIKACSLRHYEALPNHCHYLLFNSIITSVSVELSCFVFVVAVEGQRFSTAWRWLTLGVRDWKDGIPFQITPSSPMPGVT